MNDLERFEAFFKEMGVDYAKSNTYETIRPKRTPGQTIAEWKAQTRKEPRTLLTVTQAHFHFTPEGRYLGAEADEMGYFLPRR